MRSNYHKYTEEEKNFLRENISKYTYEELAKAFNGRFETNIPRHSISDVCTKRMKIKRNCNTGLFKNGAKPQFDVGAEIVKDGYVWVKCGDNYHKGKYSNEDYQANWKPKHRYVYEQHFGAIPENRIVVFLDGNKNNFGIDNLYCISRSVHATMCSNNWFKKNATLTLTAIKYCELQYVIKQEVYICK